MIHSSVSHFIASDSGAVTVDWVVLAAAVVGLGVSSVAAVRTGTSSLATSIDGSLTGASAINGILILDGFVFVDHTVGLQLAALESFAERSDELLLQHSSGHAQLAMEALALGDMAAARFWTERYYLSSMALRGRGLDVMQVYPGTPSLQSLQDAIAAA